MRVPSFSLEVFPTKPEAGIDSIFSTVEQLQSVKPDYVSVTFGTGKSSDLRRTADVCNKIHERFEVPTIAHLTGLYLSKDEADIVLQAYQNAGVQGVLVLRGDKVEGREVANVFHHASDLAQYIHDNYPQFDLYGACYPQKHPDAESLDSDIDNLQYKIDAGVSRLITQLFFDNDDYERFAEKVRAKGIDLPIDIGIMPVSNAGQIRRMTSLCSATIPKSLQRIMSKWEHDPDSLRKAGFMYVCEQISELVAMDVSGIHLYTLNQPEVTKHIWQTVQPLFAQV
ncbi:MAG: methylenetetrahydrofolate reductase [NAD(P)H] [Bifidobacteriaceae bacterium]|nr:methylenetetrahydrofolate reductase [NAD(P)H] [Bifidobacteriaceae bacterium]